MQIHSYRIPLRKPFETAGGEVTHREGFWIRDRHSQGECWAECAPLPGFSIDTLSENRKQLHLLDGILNELATLPTMELQLERLEQMGLPPAFEFAVSVLTIDRSCREQMLKVGMFLGVPVVHDVHVNGVLDVAGGASAGAGEALQALLNKGVREVKGKVSGEDRTGLGRWAELAEAFPSMRFKLDFNGSIPPEQVAKVVRAMPEVLRERLRYVEDPCRVGGLEAARRLRRSMGSGISLALDDCVRRGSESLLESVLKENLADVLVVKPMAFGAVHRLLSLRKSADKRGTAMVLTTLLETGVGRAEVAQVAAMLGSPDHSHGLLTGHVLQQDVRDDDWLRNHAVSIPPGIGWHPPGGVDEGWRTIKSRVTSLSAMGLAERIV